MSLFGIRLARSLNSLHRWLLPTAAVLTFTGYVRPWIDHKAAGLAVLGLDLAELVKFLHPVQQGEIRLWREGFYLPLVAVSVSLSLHAFRRAAVPSGGAGEIKAGEEEEESSPYYGWPLRVVLLLMAVVSALNLLPPAWTPRLLLSPEFRLQTVVMIACLGLAALSPIAALLILPGSILGQEIGQGTRAKGGRITQRPAWALALFSTLVLLALTVSAVYFPLIQFRQVLPTLTELYGQPPDIGWGPAIMVAGLAGLFLYGLKDMIALVRK